MELRHLRYFIAVGRCLNFTKAAELLHITQPALSRQIQELEEDVGASLLIRQGKTTTLTASGAFLLEEAEGILEALEAARATAQAIATESGSLRIGCASFIMGTTVSDLLAEFRSRFPDTGVDLLILSTEAQEKALFSGAIDFGFVRTWVSRLGLVFEPVAVESLAIVYPESYPDASDREDLLELLQGMPFIGFPPKAASGLAGKIVEVRESLGFQGKATLECNDAHSILGLVAAGLGWSIIPVHDLSAADHPGCRSLLLEEGIEFGLAYRESQLSPLAESFLRVAKAHYARRRTSAG